MISSENTFLCVTIVLSLTWLTCGFFWLLWSSCKICILQIRKTWLMDETVNCTIEHVQAQSSFLSGVKEHTTLEGKDRQIFVIFWGQPGIHREFQKSQKHVERSCFINKMINYKQTQKNKWKFISYHSWN